MEPRMKKTDYRCGTPMSSYSHLNVNAVGKTQHINNGNGVLLEGNNGFMPLKTG